MPCPAPLPVPTIMAVGVASPKAHGQATISTATKANSAKVNTGDGPMSIHKVNVLTAMTMTVGTK